jgi:drug/metabolite transporter (DMT)-like permease
MKFKTIGVILASIGIIMIVYTGFSYITKEKVVDLGPIEINKETTHPVQWSPIVGAILLIGGIVFIVIPKSNS